ncbi:hypothetical protein DVJ83_08895 [Deinococcus wulumuqiensis]|uniref:DUF3325 domain-containing protein n=1 Tax=Deinococcus wulumuqiensis TaxID=980427 RepID=A0A345IHS6_9DEIO|nr:hypothetical protein [Deinococcus wulumuqiensis]AXG99248.1 hypothetical protein DVJ83_08895 [Deinococcus wulumuqiensis]
MWLLLTGTIVLLLSGRACAWQWLYGWHREDPQRRTHALLIHIGLTLLLCLYALIPGHSGPVLSLGLVGVLALPFGMLLVLRDPPRELSPGHLRTHSILQR